jgi:hypothetical protein
VGNFRLGAGAAFRQILTAGRTIQGSPGLWQRAKLSASAQFDWKPILEDWLREPLAGLDAWARGSLIWDDAGQRSSVLRGRK